MSNYKRLQKAFPGVNWTRPTTYQEAAPPFMLRIGNLIKQGNILILSGFLKIS